ncbi:zinc-dependent alcohol dehydrogenase [Muricomes intestini]|jgi:L-iditol 2-dehydrogenase|uniref:L-iditol 2-dehydrogenase n=1 Tax=Muricomes intestini TaxID=1796634 RepID=A0A4R3KDB9_9FIRM|nr:zinc-binding dehydrogenase [Muricomes intestini]TCS81138.1 L-iditol 2-dehydrogenase [Muricomes intestini]HAX52056.1 sorbitol dehydrogenase [Lachnospiraceae bacterium]
MKTVIVNKEGTLSVKEIPKPKYGPKQALTKTIANGICGTDVHLMKKAFKGITEDMYPVMLGHENVGEVVEVGSEVKGLKAGDKVLLPFLDADPEYLGPYESAWGALSEYCVVNDAAAFAEGEVPDLAKAQCVIPDDIDPVDAVMLITFGEVLSSVKYFGIQKDKPVVIYGCGPVGLTFIKMCKMVGASPVIAVVRNEAKRRNALEGGADIVLNSTECDITKEIRTLFPKGVPYVVDAVGSEEVVNDAMGLICDRGEICCYGVPRKEEMHIDFSKADYNWVINFQQFPLKGEEAIAHDEVIQWIREGKIDLKDYISDYFIFDDVIEAYDKALNKKVLKKGIVVYK